MKQVSTTAQGVEIKIATEVDMRLDGLSVVTRAGTTPLKASENKGYVNQADGKTMEEHTLLFDTTAAPEYLLIEGMHYLKKYNEVIEISLD
ncbi:hypothetical protein [Paenibacillus sp. FJAT-26967]|uniref:hypothetical protein n=1 Tax=Paenibacillus sp. FJAT-26967 TaxID=1729690 RepID=UPI0008388B8B|nr:hypothetical protein [Paenibacillus sp. FJAT-26967]